MEVAYMILWKKKEICSPDQMEVTAKILNNSSLEGQINGNKEEEHSRIIHLYMQRILEVREHDTCVKWSIGYLEAIKKI